MRRTATLLSMVVAAFWLAALPAGAGEDSDPMKPAPSAVPSAAPDSPRAADAHATEADLEYVVEEGDTLAEIAEEQLGSAEKWKLIARANGIDDPRTLRVGQKLTLPPSAAPPQADL
jgi:nucleoid-associated protein YgaU